MIAVADERFYKGIDYLYRTCFNTDGAYMRAYFGRMLSIGENIVNVTDDGTVASTLTLFPCTISLGASRFPVGYVFSVGTLESYRKKGLATELLDWTAEYARRKGMLALHLVPQNEWLFDFYGKLGYKTAFYINKTTVRNYELPRASELAQVPRFVKMNRGFDVPKMFMMAHSDRYSLQWTRKMYEHLRIDSTTSHGGLLYAKQDGATMLMACFGRPRIDTVLVKDFAVPSHMQKTALRGLADALPAGNYEILTASDCQVLDYPIEKMPYGMLKPLGTKGEELYEFILGQQNDVFYSPLVD